MLEISKEAEKIFPTFFNTIKWSLRRNFELMRIELNDLAKLRTFEKTFYSSCEWKG